MSDDFIGDDDDEVIIGDDESSPNFLETPSSSADIPSSTSFLSLNRFLQPYTESSQHFLPDFHFDTSDSSIKFKVPSNLLPSSLRMVCGFYITPTLIDVTLTFQTPSWKSPLSMFSAVHPYYKQNYVGRPLVYETIRTFFTSAYKPKREYRSTAVLFQNGNQDNNINYQSHPLIFLISEILDSFYDIQDHCCICRKKLPFSVIKPSICDQKLCEVSFNEIGVGTSVVQEIRRDLRAADLLLSLFACSTQDERYMKPSPPDDLLVVKNDVFYNLPDMITIANTCKSDADIYRNFGQRTLDFLRWIILSNKSQLFHLPEQLKLKSVPFETQFMTLIASPEKEAVFQRKKNQSAKYDGKKKQQSVGRSVFMWHGSSGERWHSIFRNGLKNMSNIDCVNGAWYGPGIYLAADSSMSLSYTHTVKNLYRNSMFGPKFTLIALCEVVPNKSFKNFGNFATLQDNDAIIVRFVFPVTDDMYSNSYSCDAVSINRSSIPTIEDVLNYLKDKDCYKM